MIRRDKNFLSKIIMRNKIWFAYNAQKRSVKMQN